MRKARANFQDIVPFIAFSAIFIFFTFASYNENTGAFRMLSLFNLSSVLEQTMQTVIVACGMLFVVSQGHIDMSVGTNLALSGVVATWAAHASGAGFLLIPVSLLVGCGIGIFNGVVVSRFKVPSFMLTLAMLIGLRGLVNYIQVGLDVQRLPVALSFLTVPAVKAILFLIIVLIFAYIFEFTNNGRYSRAIGENETAAKFTGIPVNKTKVIAFALSGLMAGTGAIFSVVTIGSTTQQMGVFLEIRVIMAIFLGGVLVTGGSSAKFYKILLGSFSIQFIMNGLMLIGRGDSSTSQAVLGTLLLVILLLSAFAGNKAGWGRHLPGALSAKQAGLREEPDR